jgi:hypothetical protein
MRVITARFPIRIEPTETVTDIWCDTCQKPSKVQTGMVAVFPDGVTPLGNWELCPEHADEWLRIHEP